LVANRKLSVRSYSSLARICEKSKRMGPNGESQPILMPALARRLALSSTVMTENGFSWRNLSLSRSSSRPSVPA
jgi:hypothetical protein